MNRIVPFILFCIGLYSCVPSMDAERLYLKEITTPDLHIEWFFYSTISNTTPDYVIVNDNNQTDTVCIAHNITDIYLKANTIYICSDGYPELYGKSVEVRDKVQDYVIRIEIDTERRYHEVRPFYKKSK